MKHIFHIILITYCLSVFSQPVDSLEEIKYSFYRDSIYSTELDGYRTIKIYLPKGYNTNKTYPVLFTLDAEWMFEPTVVESKILSEFDVIPPSIVIGIFHNERNKDLGLDWKTGEFTESSSKFYHFLEKKLIPSIDSNYSTSKFNILIGHSNSATFCHKVLTQQGQPFKGFIALSQNLFGSQLQEFVDFIQRPLKNQTYYYVASGTRDATPRLESGIKLDSIFQLSQNEKLKCKQSLYNADHNGIAAKGLNNAISFIFSDYKHFNDWNDQLIDSLTVNKINSIDFMNDHITLIKEIYGVEFVINQDDLSLMQALTRTDEDIKAIQDFEIKHFGQDEYFYATYAQYYERIQNYEKALEHWNKNIKEGYEHNQYFFYYRRPVELLYIKMKDPKRAITYTKELLKEYPEKSLYLNYMIGKIASENNVKKKDGIESIKKCIEHYKSNSLFDLEQAKKIEGILTQ